MHRISALLHKRPKDGKHSDLDDDISSYSQDDVSEGSSRSFQSPPRLVRSPGIRGLRKPEDTDLSRFSLSNAADADFSESPAISASDAHTVSNLSSRYSASNFQTVSPLPSPPRSPVLGAGQAPSLWPLPSPRQLPKKHEDNDRNLNGFSHLDNDNGFILEAEMHKATLSPITTENFQRCSPPSGLTVSLSPRVGGIGYGNSGVGSHSKYIQFGGVADIPTHAHTKQVEPGSNNGRILNPMQNSQESKGQKDSWRWTHEHALDEEITADEFLSAEYKHVPKYSYQNGPISKDVRLSPCHSQAVGSSTPSSPPLSPSKARGLSPGGWIKGHLLGTGAFGKVYKGIHSGTGEFCAIKEVELVEGDHRSRESAEQLKKEISSLSTLQHPNIVQYKGSELVGNSLHIYLELISGGSLYKLYREFKKLEEPVIRRYTRQILLGLHYLHSRKFVHRDIKCANILVDQDGTVKLADFGVSKYIKEQGVPFSLRGSPHWMAPEVILSLNTGYEYAVDIWSLGCTVIEMVTGKPPWCDLEAAAAMFKVTKVGAPPIPENLSADGKSFIKLCLQRNPADRPTAASLLEHPFVRIQSESHHNALYAYDAPNNVDYGEPHWVHSSVSSPIGIYPSSSAPSSPRSSRRPVYGFSSSQPDLVSHERDIARGLPVTHIGQSKSSVNHASPHRRHGKPKGRIPPSGQRHSHEFTKQVWPTQQGHSHEFTRHARPSLSAPVSPKSSHMYGNLSPVRSADILTGYPTPFSDSRGS